MSSRKAKSNVVIYIEPIGERVNSEIVRLIGGQDIDIAIMNNVKCRDGQTRNLWRCNKNVLQILLTQRSEDFQFNVFVQHGRYNDIISGEEFAIHL